MIVIRVEMWPHGDKSRAYLLGVAGIANIGGTKDKGNYSYVIGLKRKSKWRMGEIMDFPRGRLNVWFLVKRILNEMSKTETLAVENRGT